MSLAKELSDTIRYLEGIRGQLNALDWTPINALLGALDASLERARDAEARECCTLGCGEPAAPRRLHCESHCEVSIGCQRVRTTDGRELPITVDEIAWSNAWEDTE